ncbi:RNA polymerase sigma factor [Methylomonas sp. MS20]|uniref:RNA polymerase sigma factor n=1 Tax=unclassified Methylomonas TaxID=2608980 RepID=UPI0028A3782E|nr:RNA polymerase sigma factor [Methylomonas sp. MV1]MDT4332351.1 RNA polymerase sigma factor [Methylomonas sp. MV1]
MYRFSPDFANDLIQRHRDELLGFLAPRVRCPETAADILQDAFFRLTQFESESQIANPRAFLYKVVGNLAIDHLRKHQREAERHAAEEELAEHADATPDLERQVYSRQKLLHLQQAVSELPPKCREVFVLHKFHHYPYSQIMRELNIAESTVLKHINKALEHCRRRMRELELSERERRDA